MPTLDELRLALSEEASDAEEARQEQERQEIEEARQLAEMQERVKLEGARRLREQQAESIKLKLKTTLMQNDGTIWFASDLPLWTSTPQVPGGFAKLRSPSTIPELGDIVHLPLPVGSDHAPYLCSINGVAPDVNHFTYECTWDWQGGQRRGQLIVKDGNVCYWRQTSPGVVPEAAKTIMQDGQVWNVSDLGVMRQSIFLPAGVMPALGDTVQLPIEKQVTIPVEIIELAPSTKTVQGLQTFVGKWNWADQKSGELVVYGGKVILWRQYNTMITVDSAPDTDQTIGWKLDKFQQLQGALAIPKMIMDHGFESNDGVITNRCIFWYAAGSLRLLPKQCGAKAEDHATVETPKTATATQVMFGLKATSIISDDVFKEYPLGKCQHTWISTNSGHIICGSCGVRAPWANNG